MNEITLKINGTEVKGKAGDTVLEVCQANGIDVPTLCHLDGLSDIGACRMCVVEIERERRPVPACTYPARDGLVVNTNTDYLERYRRQILELIFTEHNHFCMFCEASGDCELQKLAYRYQMDHVRYPYAFPSLSVDSISNYLVIDHNRCILCGRCIRACSEVAASNTLSFSQRGWKTLVSADLQQPLGESSCQLCGACIQACPTGAIFNKLNVYKGTAENCQHVKTACTACGVGCELNVLVKDNNLVMIEAPSLKGDPRGVLCRIGRFDLLDSTPPRILSPLIRGESGDLEECNLDKAVQVIAERVNDTKGDFAGLASTRITSEVLSLFGRFIKETVGSDLIDTQDGESYRIISEGIQRFQGNGAGLDIECTIEDILDTDCIIVVAADPQKMNPVVSTVIRRAISQQKAKLIVIDPERDVFPLWTDLWLKPRPGSEGILLNGLANILIKKNPTASHKVNAEFVKSLGEYEVNEVTRSTGIEKEGLELMAEMYSQAKRGAIIYGEEFLQRNDANSVATILNLAKMTDNQVENRLRVISLKPRANSRGAWELGLARGINQDKPKGLYILLGDEPVNDSLMGLAREADFLVVQSSYHSPLTAAADVVLPSPTWAEREGRCVAMDGRVIELKPALQSMDGIPKDEETLIEISSRLGHKLL